MVYKKAWMMKINIAFNRVQPTKMALTLLFIFIGLSVICRVGEGAPCNFDVDLCNYTQDTTDDFDWIRINGASSMNDTGPDADHTHGTSQGYYVYANAGFPQTPGLVSRLIGQPIPVLQTSCLQFYYYMHGEHMGSLRVYSDVISSNPVWSRSGSQGRQWFRGLATLEPSPGSDQVIFEAITGSGILSDIAIDDVNIVDGACPIENLNCDFENDENEMCGFAQDQTDDFDFLLIQSRTPTVATGPNEDHTYGNTSGHYIYIEGSENVLAQRARIISPTIRGVQTNDREGFCVVFWYYMHGSGVGELNVYLRNESSLNLGKPIWGIAGERGEEWKAAEVKLNTPEDFYVVFEATRGLTSFSGIAIDDIEITNYGCPGFHNIGNERNISCDFEEEGMCSYSLDPTSTISWEWTNRASPGSTGPTTDHSIGNELGYFMYVSSTTFSTSADRARLLSPVAERQSASSCVEFWYHVYGRDTETLNVYVKLEGVVLPSSPAWSITGNQGNYWHRATFNIPANTNNYRLVFEAIPGDAVSDDVAIDDITFYEGTACPIPSTVPPLPATSPTAVTSLDCNFELGFCGYEQEYENDQADWAREQGKYVASSETGPQVDHSLGTSEGYYAMFDPSLFISLDRNEGAILVSPFLQASNSPRCVQFYAFMYGNNVDYLNIYIRPWGATTSLDPQFSIYGNIANEWRLYGMNVPRSNKHFHVLFQANVGRFKSSGKIAIDDIRMVTGMCPEEVPPTLLPWGADCDFEQNGTLCGYTQRSSDAFDWIWHQGSTGSTNTGPHADHTLGTPQGHYMYIETSLPQRPGDRASLVSPVLNSQDTDICLRFYYHATGEGDIGTLRIIFKLEGLSSLVELFRVTGNKGDRWIPVNIDIPASSTGFSDFEIRFDGYKGYSIKGDLAVDDITFLRQPCEGYPTEGRCTFEHGLEYCGYTLRTENDVTYPTWQWYDRLAVETSPLINITSTSFMYSMSNARNISPVMYSDTYELRARDHCLTAKVLLLNDDGVQLNIAVQEGTSGRRSTVGTFGGITTAFEWVTEGWKVPSDSVTGPFRIVFSTTIQGGSNGIVAIDDVNFTPLSGECGQANTDGDGTSTRSGSSGENPGLIAGIIIILLLLIAVIIIAFMIHLRKSFSAKLPITAYSSRQPDEQPVIGEDSVGNADGIRGTSFMQATYDHDNVEAQV
ncbi:MAM and LDL-receptor class A domain-containing protein 1-like [Lytechinus variegatus]|uniref:MAM and LDL-receptor class A domain-containing protein 1-like n=1 Tax=Lytechinus variegatus TaxID=7654 RepID=UPI001BB254CD|nr:MAM and LDL-receptor class A domain-containing protein 1-like [Lytechinus variegatus]